MKIGVISDTHVPTYVPDLPRKIFDTFQGVDLILHAGDMVRFDVVHELETLAPVKAVAGNMDTFRNQGLLPDKRIVTAGQCRIGLIHGWGSPAGLEQRVLRAFLDDSVHAVVFGHSHNALCREHNGILVFNPGSPTSGNPSGYNSVGMLTVDGNSVHGQIIRL
jgi:hypothetical protein